MNDLTLPRSARPLWGQICIGRGWRRRGKSGAAAASAAPEEAEPRWVKVVEFLFQVFLMLVMVRVASGAADSEAARAAREAATASGDAVKQAAYTFAFFLFGWIWVRYRGWRLPRSLAPIQLILLGWILLSATWAVDQNLSIRRSILTFFVFFTIGMAVDLLGPQRSMACLYRMLALCTTVSLISIPFFSFAVHPATETDPSIVGGWRGIFVHKNTAAAICAVAALIFMHYWLTRRRWYDVLFFTVCIVFLIGSKSKTPLGFLPVAAALSILYRVLYGRLAGRISFHFALVTILTSLALGYFAYEHVIDAVFNDPMAFTGRVEIWTSAVRYIEDHPWLGAGYSSLWATSVTPPIMPYTTSPYEEFIVHSHNGYLELLGTIGVPGLAMALVGAFIIPFSQIFRDKRPDQVGFNSTAFAILIFCMLENFLETQLYTRDREIWVCLFVAILALQMNFATRNDGRRSSETRDAASERRADRRPPERQGWRRSLPA